MGKQERKNMIDFIQKIRKLDKDELMYMTDQEIDSIYEKIYNQYETIAE